tara:strand:+ start:1350 stop:1568 length:219 start_codon:yes stop_codon:yes gene_type:complete
MGNNLPTSTVIKALKRIRKQIEELKAEGFYHDYQGEHEGNKESAKKAREEFKKVDALKKVVKKTKKKYGGNK